MKIGFTEHGDAGLDLSWAEKLNTVNGVIAITKNITPGLAEILLNLKARNFPFILHATCTGWGASVMEPHVPEPFKQLQAIVGLILAGIPYDRIVLRVDPIIPNTEGLARLANVLQMANQMGITPACRVRVSVMDEYPHVRERFAKAGIQPINNTFHANAHQLQQITDVLKAYGSRYETCAEAGRLTDPIFIHQGCISMQDLNIMGLNLNDDPGMNRQNRGQCMCLGIKKELFPWQRKNPCPHGCLYCFWKDSH